MPNRSLVTTSYESVRTRQVINTGRYVEAVLVTVRQADFRYVFQRCLDLQEKDLHSRVDVKLYIAVIGGMRDAQTDRGPNAIGCKKGMQCKPAYHHITVGVRGVGGLKRP